MLHFDIDYGDLVTLQDELAASDRQVYQAFNRALTRTAGTLRRMSSKGLKDELQLRNAKAIRKRLRTLRLKRGKLLDEVKLWYGTNDLPVSAFKGTPSKTGRGATFRGTIFKRRGRGRLPLVEQTLTVKDKMDVFLEDEIFTEVEEIFFKHFRADLRARTIYGAGRS
jgi:hypothetical protein